MGHAGSYTITLSNNRAEKKGISYLLKTSEGFMLPDKESRKQILSMLKLNKSFSRAFDLILIKGNKKPKAKQLSISNPRNIILVELKTTRKKLLHNPHDFFFGATANEFKLARKMRGRYLFCFVCLHPQAKSYTLLTLAQAERLIKTKRIQYQINFKSKYIQKTKKNN